MDCICFRQKPKRRREKHRPISPHTSPPHSQPSTLSPVSDARLPKVNSTGLWIGAPSLYSAAPNAAYYYGRPVTGYPYPYHPGAPHIQRSTSEMRIPPIPHGGQRIYHSQQLAPVYESPRSRDQNMDIYDVYHFGGASNSGPRSKLVETKHSQFYNSGEFKLNAKVERSHSDAYDKRPSKKKEPKRESSKKSRSSSRGSNKDRSSSKEKKSSQVLDSLREATEEQKIIVDLPDELLNGHENKGFNHDSGLGRSVSSKGKRVPVVSSTSSASPNSSITAGTSSSLQNGKLGLVSAIVSGNNSEKVTNSATDSIKLLANNKTDDQKTIIPEDDKVADQISYNQYIYQGDIYSKPMKTSKVNEDDEISNPIINRMKEMVIEKNKNKPIGSVGELDKTPPVVSSTSSKQIISQNGDLYEEIRTVKRTETTEVTVYEEPPGTSLKSAQTNTSSNKTNINNSQREASLDNFTLPELSNLEESKTRFSSQKSKPRTSENKNQANESQHIFKDFVETEMNAETKVVQKEAVPANRDIVSRKSSTDIDAAPEDLNRAGKRITASAFEFLDTYLSDDEGTVSQLDSPPMSPGSLIEQRVN